MYFAAVGWQRALPLFVRAQRHVRQGTELTAERDFRGGRTERDFRDGSTRFGTRVKASSAGHRTVGRTWSSADRGLPSHGPHRLDRPSPSSQQVAKWFQRQHRVGS